MKKILNNYVCSIIPFVLIVCLFVFNANSSAVNESIEANPIWIATTVFENGLMLKYAGLERYVCKNKVNLIKTGAERARVEIEKKKIKGIDFYKQANFDFSKITYTPVSDGTSVDVYISGPYVLRVAETDFEYKGEVNEIHKIINEDGNFKWCGFKNNNAKVRGQ